jgi:uncharacterized membrane protein HdeD (DUF308 family)
MSHADDALPGVPVSWRAPFALSVITVALGVIIAFHPTQSLTAVAVLLGIVVIVSGIFHIARAVSGTDNERLWPGITGVLFLLAGLVLLRHLNLSVALIGLLIGVAWIVQGVTVLMDRLAGEGGRADGDWWVFFGTLSLIAGTIVISVPVKSATALATVTGVWFIILGVMEMIGSLVFRRAPYDHRTAGVSVPAPPASH